MNMITTLLSKMVRSLSISCQNATYCTFPSFCSWSDYDLLKICACSILTKKWYNEKNSWLLLMYFIKDGRANMSGNYFLQACLKASCAFFHSNYVLSFSLSEVPADGSSNECLCCTSGAFLPTLRPTSNCLQYMRAPDIKLWIEVLMPSDFSHICYAISLCCPAVGCSFCMYRPDDSYCS